MQYWQSALVLLLCLGAAQTTASQSGFQGLWVLDPERSEAPHRANRRTVRSLERTLQDEQHATAEDLLAALRQPVRQLQLELGDQVVTLTSIVDPKADGEDGRRQERHYTDGRPTTVDSSTRSQSIAGWEDDQLFIEKVTMMGLRVLEVWSLKDDRLRIDVEARNRLLDDPIRYRLTYLPAPDLR